MRITNSYSLVLFSKEGNRVKNLGELSPQDIRQKAEILNKSRKEFGITAIFFVDNDSPTFSYKCSFTNNKVKIFPISMLQESNPVAVKVMNLIYNSGENKSGKSVKIELELSYNGEWYDGDTWEEGVSYMEGHLDCYDEQNNVVILSKVYSSSEISDIIADGLRSAANHLGLDFDALHEAFDIYADTNPYHISTIIVNYDMSFIVTELEGNALEEFEASTPSDDDDEDEEYINRVYVERLATEYLGPQNQYSGSADWGGIPVWTIEGDKFEGKFFGIEDEDRVFLMTRKFDEVSEETSMKI